MSSPTTEEECLLYFKQLDKTCQDANLALVAHKEWVQTQFAKEVRFCSFEVGEFVSLYHPKQNLSMKILPTRTYELQDRDGIPLKEPKYGLYLKEYCA